MAELIKTCVTNVKTKIQTVCNNDNFSGNRNIINNEEPLYVEEPDPSVGEADSIESGGTESAENLNELEQRCILIPTYASKDTEGKDEWAVRVHGWAYATRRKSRKRKIMMGVARRIVKDEQQTKLLEDRLGLFLTKNLRDQLYNVRVIGLAHPTHMELGRGDPDVDGHSDSGGSNGGDSDDYGDTSSAPDDDTLDDNDNFDSSRPVRHFTANSGGHFDGIIHVSNQLIESWAQKELLKASEEHKEVKRDGFGNHGRLLKLEATHVSIHDGKKHVSKALGYADLIDHTGISIISDIDDTIKDTGILDGPRTVLSNTFLKVSEEVDGMSQRYQKWYEKGAAIHYVSNSPWQLFPVLKSFFDDKSFPVGSAHLKFYNDFKNLTERTGQNKKNTIRQILDDFPRRKYILVGDSGEMDMEIYEEIVKRYKDRILHIFIRDVSSERLKNMPEKRSKSLPFIPKRATSGNSIKASKTISDIHVSTSPTSPTSPGSPDESKSPYQVFEERWQKIRDTVAEFGTGFSFFETGDDILDTPRIVDEFKKLAQMRGSID